MRALILKPVGMLAGVAASMVAGAVVKRVWHATTGEDETPRANDPEREWVAVIAAAALQGVVFATVKAVIDRATVAGVRRLTPAKPE